MTSHDEKILQLLDRIHATAQGRREKTIDGAVQTMERVNRTSYGALRDLTENGHKKGRPEPTVHSWQSTQELLVNDDHLSPQAAASKAQAAGEASPTEVTAVMVQALPDAPTAAHDPYEATAIMAAPAALLDTAAPVALAAPAAPSPAAREHAPEAVVSGDGATYGGQGSNEGSGSLFQETQVIWFRRLFRRR